MGPDPFSPIRRSDLCENYALCFWTAPVPKNSQLHPWANVYIISCIHVCQITPQAHAYRSVCRNTGPARRDTRRFGPSDKARALPNILKRRHSFICRRYIALNGSWANIYRRRHLQTTPTNLLEAFICNCVVLCFIFGVFMLLIVLSHWRNVRQLVWQHVASMKALLRVSLYGVNCLLSVKW